ncbi:MAG: RluA family pseudouridine synthase [Rhizobiaceae bacterium]
MTAGDDAAGLRLDQWLGAKLGPDISRSQARRLIESGDVTVNGAPAEPKKRLRPGDRIEWRQPEAVGADPEPEDIALDILYEDRHLIVIDKPAGMVVHPGAGHATGTLVNALLFHCGDTLSGIGGVRRPGIVHRLDRDTSGVMVVAKDDPTHRALSEAFADHGRTGELERSYLAVVWGAPPRMAGTIDAPLGRAANDRTRRAVVPEGRGDARRAVTHFSVLKRFGSRDGGEPAASLIECRLETGRTHQIRVHMAHIGHALVGDPVYGAGYRTKANLLPEPQRSIAASFSRQALHAARLTFRHPASGELMRFSTALPPDMDELVKALEIP